MAPWRRAALLSSAVVGVMTLASPISEAHGRGPRGPRGTVVVGGFRGGFYAPAFGFGVGYAPYWGPWGWGWADGPALPPPGGGIDLGAALVAGYGAVEMNAKPGQAEVWVDGKFVAEARDLDGYPSYLWLPEGAHRVTVYQGGFASFDEPIEVRRGIHQELKVRLQKGESTPPGERPKGAKERKAAKPEPATFSF
jgi:hypothetical protein